MRFIPITFSHNKRICAPTLLRELFLRFPGGQDACLFSSPRVKNLSYSTFSRVLKTLITRAGLEGDFASYSLRGGGATFMSLMSCSVTEIKERGQWVSVCVYRYVKHPLSHSLEVDKRVALNC